MLGSGMVFIVRIKGWVMGEKGVRCLAKGIRTEEKFG